MDTVSGYVFGTATFERSKESNPSARYTSNAAVWWNDKKKNTAEDSAICDFVTVMYPLS